MLENHFPKVNQYRQSDQLREAIVAYRKAISFNPDCYLFYQKLADALKNSGDLHESIQAYRQALKLRPDAEWCYFNLAEVLVEPNKISEAITAYRKAISLNPEIQQFQQKLNQLMNKQKKDTIIDLTPQKRARYKQKVILQLMTRKKWAYLRYLHLREGFLRANNLHSFLSIGCGTGLAEVALALEFPDIQFHLTDIGTHENLQSRLGMRMIHEWGIPNASFATCNILDISSQQLQQSYDFVASVEVLEHIQDDKLAINNMKKISQKYVYTLVPFATDSMNSDPVMRERVWKNQEHYRVGYNRKQLVHFFADSEILALQGCYWEKLGFKVRQTLDELTSEEIQNSMTDLLRLAGSDTINKAPNKQEKCYGIWVLASV